MSALPQPARTAAPPDPLFKSGFFARVPEEALSRLAFAGPAAMSHVEFRVFVALCRFRGPTRVVNPARVSLGKMTGVSPNNISRTTANLQTKGWLTIHYVPGSESRIVENYELHLAGTHPPRLTSPKSKLKVVSNGSLTQQAAGLSVEAASSARVVRVGNTVWQEPTDAAENVELGHSYTEPADEVNCLSIDELDALVAAESARC